MIISIIVAMDQKGGIGKNNRLPWHLPSDLKRFKKITMGHHLIMGRKTFETIGKPLPGRTMIILTRNHRYQANSCTIAHSLPEALQLAQNGDEREVFIIGGGDVFEEAIRIAEKIYLTIVSADVEADTYFPKIDQKVWKTIINEEAAQLENDDFSSKFKVLVREKINKIGIDKFTNPHIIRQT